VELGWVELVQTSCGFNVEWVAALEVDEQSGRNESGDVNGFGILLVVEEEKAIATSGWEKSFGHVV
jgi:hypothetical protein